MIKVVAAIIEKDGKILFCKRGAGGNCAGLWEFPNVPGKLETGDALTQVEFLGLRPQEIYRQVERKHIFTHIRWEMRGIYMEVAEPGGDFNWRTAEEIRQDAALPTAFRQFWEVETDV